MKPLFRCTVVLLIDGFLSLRERENFGSAFPTKNGPLKGIKMMIARGKAIKWAILGCSAPKIAEVRTVVDIQSRHLVEAHNRVEVRLLGCFLHLVKEATIPHMIATDST